MTPPDGDGNGVPDPDVFVAIGMIALAGAMVALAIAVWRRRPGPLPDAADDVEPAGIPPESASAAEPPQPADPESGEESEPAGAATVDPELLSDEERVEHLLEANDGRMRQADIVTETGWSNAKVSQLLSGMAEEGRVEKLRMGRENLISLPDAEETEE